MKTHHWPLCLLFLLSGPVHATYEKIDPIQDPQKLLTIPPILIPISVAYATQFKDPANINATLSNSLSDYVGLYFDWIAVSPIPTLIGNAHLFIDTRTGQYLRLVIGDTVLVKFSDGSTMKMTFQGLGGTRYFRPVPSSLRAPGPYPLLPRFPFGGGILGGSDRGRRFIDWGGSRYSYVINFRSTVSGSCLTGMVSMCNPIDQYPSF